MDVGSVQADRMDEQVADDREERAISAPVTVTPVFITRLKIS